MISNKAKTGIAPIDFNKVCNIVASDLKEKFSDIVLSVGKVKHKVNHSVLTLIIPSFTPPHPEPHPSQNGFPSPRPIWTPSTAR